MQKQYQLVGKREDKWHVDLNCILSLNFWQRCKHFISQIKYHNDIVWLQTQLLRNTLKTNYIVSKFVPLVNERCTFECGQIETNFHLFYGCVHINNFFNDLREWLHSINVHKYGIKTDRLSILFGIHNEEANSEKNLILLAAKKFIWLQKFRKLVPRLDRFKTYLFDFIKNLKFIHEIKNDNEYFAECRGGHRGGLWGL